MSEITQFGIIEKVWFDVGVHYDYDLHCFQSDENRTLRFEVVLGGNWNVLFVFDEESGTKMMQEKNITEVSQFVGMMCIVKRISFMRAEFVELCM